MGGRLKGIKKNETFALVRATLRAEVDVISVQRY